MNKTLKNLLLLIAGIFLGMLVNWCLIFLGNQIFPFSEVNLLNADTWELKYFIFPFLAHAFGSFSGAFLVSKFAASYQMLLALIVGAFSLAGGIYMVLILPAPLWFVLPDLILAYIPMSYSRSNNRKEIIELKQRLFVFL